MDEKDRSDVISPLNAAIRVIGCFRPEEIGGARGESPYLRGGQTSGKQALDHEMGSGVTPVCRKPQRQIASAGKFREERQGLIWLDSIR
jgi:hypothetical protein